jgi:AcrR family transcriptional regulator
MMGMSIPYEESGRTAQKLRTRDALVGAARALIARGITPTVEDAAKEASISRTTSYRYFPNQRELLVAAHPFVELPSLLPANAPDDVAERLDIVLDAYLRTTIDNEPALRAALKLSLDGNERDLVLRQGRVIGWLEDCLSPLRDTLSRRDIKRLALAIRASAGIESLVWLVDVAGLSRPEAVKLMKWSAHALLRTARGHTRPRARSRAR